MVATLITGCGDIAPTDRQQIWKCGWVHRGTNNPWYRGNKPYTGELWNLASSSDPYNIYCGRPDRGPDRGSYIELTILCEKCLRKAGILW